MNPSPAKPINPDTVSKPNRRVFAAMLLMALAVAVIAGSALAATSNLVKNGSFEKDTDGDGLPNNWVGTNLTPNDKRVCNQSKAGSCSFKIVGDTGDKEFRQDVAISGSAGEEFTLSAWTKAKILGTGTHRILMRFNSTGGGNDELFTIPDGTTPWTLHQVTGSAAEDFDSITVILQFEADGGKMWMDKVKLVATP